MVKRSSRNRWGWLAVASIGGLALAVYIAWGFERHDHPPIPASVEEMLTWPDEDLDFGIAALVLTKKFLPATDIQADMGVINRLADHVRAILSRRSDRDEPLTRIGAINTVLYLENGFTYDHTDEMARKIENELQYPGQIRVVVIRETRAVGFAK